MEDPAPLTTYPVNREANDDDPESLAAMFDYQAQAPSNAEWTKVDQGAYYDSVTQGQSTRVDPHSFNLDDKSADKEAVAAKELDLGSKEAGEEEYSKDEKARTLAEQQAEKELDDVDLSQQEGGGL